MKNFSIISFFSSLKSESLWKKLVMIKSFNGAMLSCGLGLMQWWVNDNLIHTLLFIHSLMFLQLHSYTHILEITFLHSHSRDYIITIKFLRLYSYIHILEITLLNSHSRDWVNCVKSVLFKIFAHNTFFKKLWKSIIDFSIQYDALLFCQLIETNRFFLSIIEPELHD